MPFAPIFGERDETFSSAEEGRIEEELRSVSVPFVANQGQVDDRVSYYAATKAGTVYVTHEGELVYALSASASGTEKDRVYKGWTLTEEPINGSAVVSGKEIAEAKVSYFKGGSSEKWHKNIFTYAEIDLGEVWPGINMGLKARNDSVEKLFVVNPGAKVDAIRLRLDGADRLDITEKGALRAKTGLGDVTLTSPAAWQEKDGRSEPVQVAYVLQGNEYGFSLGNYDPSLPVFIDPLLQSTRLGGSSSEIGQAIAVHPFSNEVYVFGTTWSTDFPGTEGGAQEISLAQPDRTDFFLARLSADLTTLLQTTYLGGSGQDGFNYDRLAIHPHSGDIYVAGITHSDDFPGTIGGAQANLNGQTDVIIARLSADLQELKQATCLGGSSYEIDASPYFGNFNFLIHPSSGDIYAGGTTWSDDFPFTSGGLQPQLRGGLDGFVARLSPDLRTIRQSTYIGGSAGDSVAGMVVHPASGDVIVGGDTVSSDFPNTSGGAQEHMNGDDDGFIACLSEDLTQLYQSTYLGSPRNSVYSDDEIRELAVHPLTGDLYASGITLSNQFPGSAGGAIPPPTYDVTASFAARLAPSLAELKQTTYLNGDHAAYVYALAIHPFSGDVYAAGYGNTDFPGTENGVQPGRCHFGSDAVVACLSKELTELRKATFLGGNQNDYIRSIASHPVSGDIYVTGGTLSDHFPGTSGGALETDPNGHGAFAARLTADLQGEPNEPPRIVSEPATEALEDQTYSYQVQISDPNPHDCFIYLLEERPDSWREMSIDRETGLITWRPSVYEIGGAYRVVVSVTDGGGLQDFQTFDITVRRPPAPPTAPSISSDPDTTAVVGQGYAYYVNAWDPNEDDVLTYTLVIAPEGMTIDSHGVIRWTPYEADLGEHDVVVRVEDQTGLFDTQQFTLAVKLPNHPPVITSTPVTSATLGRVYSYDVEAEDPDHGDVLTYYFVRRPDASMTIDSTSGLIQWTPQEVGNYDVVLGVRDTDGRYVRQSFSIDVSIEINHPPVITSSPGSSAIVGRLYAYDVEADDPDDGDVLIYSLVAGSPAGMTIDADSGLIQWMPQQAGNYGVSVSVRDSANNLVDQTFSIAVNDNVAPTITSSPPLTALEGAPYTYDVEAFDPDSDEVLTYSLEAAPSGMTIDATTGIIQWTPIGAQIGEQSITVAAVDLGGLRATQDFAISVSGNHPPQITSAAPTLSTEAAPYTYDVEAVDPDEGDILSFSLQIAPAGMSIDPATGLIQWLPGHDAVGVHEATVVVQDNEGLYDTQSFSVTVADINFPPVVASAPVKTVVAGDLYLYQIEASDPDPGDSLTFSLISSPAGMSLDPSSGLLQWSPGAGEVGYHEITLGVQDNGGLSGEQSYKLTVVAANHPPVITSAPVATAEENALYEYDVAAMDPDGADVLTFALVSAPKKMAIDETTGLIQWTPDADQDGTHRVIVGVSDDRGLSDVQAFTLTVSETSVNKIQIDATPDTLTLPIGTSDSISYSVNLEVDAPGDYTVQYVQTVSPDNGGVALKLETNSTWTATDSASWLTSQVVTGNSIGVYEITTTVTVVETGTTRQTINIVEVSGGGPALLPTASYPSAIPVSGTADVVFTVKQSRSPLPPIQVFLEQVDEAGHTIREIGHLLDDGTGGDMAANDLVYSGTVPVSADTEGTLLFRAKAFYAEMDDPVFADVLKFGVTRFPTEISPSDMSKVVTEPLSGREFISDEVLVSFIPGTSPDTISSIVNGIHGTVVGSLFGLGIYQVRIPDTGDARGVSNAVESLYSYPEVEDVEPNGIAAIESVSPNDPRFGIQWAPQKIRADEAWVISCGHGVPIAVVDSGVDYNHPELTGKVILGRDFADRDNDPMEGGYHGTHVAGIAAAKTNNNVGIAGVSWNSRILAIKAYADGESHATNGILFQGIMQAVALGAKIINYSTCGLDPSDMLHNAVRWADRSGALFVASAGNEGSYTRGYPGYYPEAFAVANATPTDERAPTSSYGEWVDIAAPGYQILSTFSNGGYNYLTGTSMSAPHVSGAAALVMSRFPELTTDQVRTRMIQTARGAAPVPGLGIGDGRLDAFEAVFNGSFEADEHHPAILRDAATLWGAEPQVYEAAGIPGFSTGEWDHYYYRPVYRPDFPAEMETGWYFLGYEDIWWHSIERDSVLFGEGGGFIHSLGPIRPVHGERMACLVTGRAGETWDFISDVEQSYYHPCLYLTFLEQRFRIQPGQTELPITLHYNFVTEELDWYHGDGFQISVEFTTGSYRYFHVLANGSSVEGDFYDQLAEVTGPPIAHLPSRDYPLRQSGWQTLASTVPLPAEATADGAMATLRFAVFDTGGNLAATDSFSVRMDSALLVDGVEFK